MSVNVGKIPSLGRFLLAWAALSLSTAQAQSGSPGLVKSGAPFSCDPAFAMLFAPASPRLGSYEVCSTTEALTAIVPPEWRVEATVPLDAFGTAGRYDRSALARLYGGRRPMVARGWIQQGNQFESVTVISPHPDVTLSRLLPGTLVIRHVIIR
jgi:hypothetical protein